MIHWHMIEITRHLSMKQHLRMLKARLLLDQGGKMPTNVGISVSLGRKGRIWCHQSSPTTSLQSIISQIDYPRVEAHPIATQEEEGTSLSLSTEQPTTRSVTSKPNTQHLSKISISQIQPHKAKPSKRSNLATQLVTALTGQITSSYLRTYSKNVSLQDKRAGKESNTLLKSTKSTMLSLTTTARRTKAYSLAFRRSKPTNKQTNVETKRKS